MPVKRYAICDDCHDREKPYSELNNRDELDFTYEDVIESGPQYETVDEWIVKAVQDPNDPIAVRHEFYCPECSTDIEGV